MAELSPEIAELLKAARNTPGYFSDASHDAVTITFAARAVVMALHALTLQLAENEADRYEDIDSEPGLFSRMSPEEFAAFDARRVAIQAERATDVRTRPETER